jgi:hypothetical protein
MLSKEPLTKIFSLYLDVNAFDVKQLSEDLRENRIPPEEAKLFREQLAEAILNHTLTPKAYKDITGDNEYNSPEELEAWLRDLWQELYPDEPIALTSQP